MTQLFKKVVVKCEHTGDDYFSIEESISPAEDYVWLVSTSEMENTEISIKISPERLRKLGQEMVRIANLLDGKGDAEKPDEYVI